MYAAILETLLCTEEVCSATDGLIPARFMLTSYNNLGVGQGLYLPRSDHCKAVFTLCSSSETSGFAYLLLPVDGEIDMLQC